MKCLLKSQNIETARPNCCAPDFATFTDDQVTRAQSISIVFFRRHVHGREVNNIDLFPLNVCVPKVGKQELAWGIWTGG